MIKVLISIKKILQKNKYNNLMMDLEKWYNKILFIMIYILTILFNYLYK